MLQRWQKKSLKLRKKLCQKLKNFIKKNIREIFQHWKISKFSKRKKNRRFFLNNVNAINIRKNIFLKFLKFLSFHQKKKKWSKPYESTIVSKSTKANILICINCLWVNSKYAYLVLPSNNESVKIIFISLNYLNILDYFITEISIFWAKKKWIGTIYSNLFENETFTKSYHNLDRNDRNFHAKISIRIRII